MASWDLKVVPLLRVTIRCACRLSFEQEFQMRPGSFVATGVPAILVSVVLLVPISIAAQSAKPTTTKSTAEKTWTVPRTPDGRPDLQGVWDFRTITPLERPKALGNKKVLSAEEAARFEQQENTRQNRDLMDLENGHGGVYPKGGVVPYNEFWYDRGNKLTDRRTSLIVDPPDGRLPPWTPEGERRAVARAADNRDSQAAHPHADSYEDLTLPVRCIIGFNAGPPMTPGAYNNNMQLVQIVGTVAILNEMVHDVRIIPLDGRPRAGIRQVLGEPRGHWEGDTLVVETSNFAQETSLAGSTSSMQLVERFTRIGPDSLLYEFTVNDPTAWTRPWTAQVNMTKRQFPIYEYACHEGNYGLAGILRGARADEAAAAAAGQKK
jgi:hypothetical protein